MADITINDEDLEDLEDNTVIVTGGSSGIGLASVKLLNRLGAKILIGDRNPPPPEVVHPNITYVPLDVTSWSDLAGLFKKAFQLHGRIDHVFANAGIAGSMTLLEQAVDESGEPMEPDYKVMDVNMKGVMNTVALALHYMKKQESGGSIVLTASASSFQRFRAVEYTVSKHGVLGLMRGLVPNLHPKLPIRVNAIAPSWTATGLVSGSLVEASGTGVQSPDVVARSVALLMADGSRHGQMIYSAQGRYREIEGGLMASISQICGNTGPSEDEVLERVLMLLAEGGSDVIDA